MEMLYSYLLYLIIDEVMESTERLVDVKFKMVDLEYRVGRKFSRMAIRDCYVLADRYSGNLDMVITRGKVLAIDGDDEVYPYTIEGMYEGELITLWLEISKVEQVVWV